MRLADFLAAALAELGVRQVFGVTGRGSLYLTDGIARSSDIEFVPLFHEQSAGFAANAVIQAGKQWSACLVSSGVAATNLFTPLLNAWQDQLSTIFITGQNHSSSSTSIISTSIRTFGEQETDIVRLAHHLSKATLLVEDPQKFPGQLVAAIEESQEGRPGPLLIDIPLDFQSAQITDSDAANQALSKLRSSSRSLYLRSESEANVFPSWARSKNRDDSDNTIFLLGPSFEALLTDKFILKLSEASNFVVCEQGANSRYFGDNYLGTVGFLACNPIANRVLFGAKRIVAVGTSFRNNLCLPGQSLVRSDAEILLVDFDREDISPHLNAASVSFASPSLATEAELEGLLSSQTLVPRKPIQAMGDPMLAEDHPSVDLNTLAPEINRLLPEDALVVVDSGFCQLIISGQGKFGPSQRLLQPHSQGCMGVALAAGYGASKAFPHRPVVILVGDGSFLMNFQDIFSVASVPKNLTVIVVDNGLYAIINKRQKELFRNRTVGTTSADGLPEVDLRAVLEASGMRVFDERGKALPEIAHLGSSSTYDRTAAILISGNPDQDYNTCKILVDKGTSEPKLETSLSRASRGT